MQRDTFSVEENSKDDVDSQNEEEIPQGERAITPGGMYLISCRKYVS